MQIRPAVAEDAAAISHLIRQLAPFFTVHPDGKDAEPFFAMMTVEITEQRIKSDNCTYWVALIGEQMVGVVAIRDNKHLFHLFVDQQFHRQGIAAQLWNVAKTAALTAGNHAGFSVNSSPFALAMYQRFGFEVIGEQAQKDGILFIPMYLALPD